MSAYPPAGEPGGEPPHNIAAAIAEVSERATLLVREEIELAKAEVTEKATKLAKGAIVGAAAGIFFAMALVFALVGCAWLLYYFLPGNNFTYFWGFFAMAVILVLLGALAGLIAAKVVKRGSPPMPTMAIEEARKIRTALSARAPGVAEAPVSVSPQPPAAPTPPASSPSPPAATPAPVSAPTPPTPPVPPPADGPRPASTTPGAGA